MIQTHRKLTKLFLSFLILLPLPIMILNSLGGLISGIWLMFLGEWRILFQGILLMMMSGSLVSFALKPSLLFAKFAKSAMDKGQKPVAVFFGSSMVLYKVILMSAWCILIMWLFLHQATESGIVAKLIWSYGVALAPWSFLAKQDRARGNQSSIFTTFLAQISYIISMFMFSAGSSLHTIVIVFFSIMIIGALAQIIVALGKSF